MTSETPNLHVVKNLNISKTEKDIEKLKTPLRLVWKCCSDAFQIGSTIFRHRGTLTLTKQTENGENNLKKLFVARHDDLQLIFAVRFRVKTMFLFT